MLFYHFAALISAIFLSKYLPTSAVQPSAVAMKSSGTALYCPNVSKFRFPLKFDSAMPRINLSQIVTLE